MVIYEIRWTHDLTFKLLNALEDDREIRQGLYPGTGANVSSANGGGKPKTDFFWQLAIQLFSDHEEYGTLIAGAKASSTKKARDPWVLKIKNQLNRFVTKSDFTVYYYSRQPTCKYGRRGSEARQSHGGNWAGTRVREQDHTRYTVGPDVG